MCLLCVYCIDEINKAVINKLAENYKRNDKDLFNFDYVT